MKLRQALEALPVMAPLPLLVRLKRLEGLAAGVWISRKAEAAMKLR
ncbi:hypothetical protein [Planococcus sp. ANT_H30]|nr:hypothetical protein [Planococcus sp. ANT_H30]